MERRYQRVYTTKTTAVGLLTEHLKEATVKTLWRMGLQYSVCVLVLVEDNCTSEILIIVYNAFFVRSSKLDLIFDAMVVIYCTVSVQSDANQLSPRTLIKKLLRVLFTGIILFA
jgi:hypothetical protein